MSMGTLEIKGKVTGLLEAGGIKVHAIEVYPENEDGSYPVILVLLPALPPGHASIAKKPEPDCPVHGGMCREGYVEFEGCPEWPPLEEERK